MFNIPSVIIYLKNIFNFILDTQNICLMLQKPILKSYMMQIILYVCSNRIEFFVVCDMQDHSYELCKYNQESLYHKKTLNRILFSNSDINLGISTLISKTTTCSLFILALIVEFQF